MASRAKKMLSLCLDRNESDDLTDQEMSRPATPLVIKRRGKENKNYGKILQLIQMTI